MKILDDLYGLDAGNYLAAQQQAMISQRTIADYARATQYVPTLADMNALQNYRPPVRVPNGWSDWYAIGDQLH